jgi:hypothetical protein
MVAELINVYIWLLVAIILSVSLILTEEPFEAETILANP